MMKKIILGLSIILLVLLFFYTCRGTSNAPSKRLNVELVYKGKKLEGRRGEYTLRIYTNKKWRIEKPDIHSWYSLSSTEGEGVKTVVVEVEENDGYDRTGRLTVYAGKEKKIVTFTQEEYVKDIVETEEDLIELVPSNSLEDSVRIEIPRLSKEFHVNKAAFVVHYTEDNVGDRTRNYSMEYNYASSHTRWVAFTFYDKTSEVNTKRSNAWSTDPHLLEYTDNALDFRGSGYDRGHLVASADRLYSIPANEQTFYYSNMSPQINSFNGGIWASLENKVQGWGALSAIRDTLYVVKGGTIASHQVMGTIGDSKIVIPKYYFMALLAKKGSIYNSIAFWFEHRAHPQPYSLHDYALSVEELEELTGIDFFHNLPDSIENVVEKDVDLEAWPDL